MASIQSSPLPRPSVSALAFALSIALTVLAFQPRASAQAAPPKPSKDVLIFTNGDQLTGNLERGVGDSVVFKSDMAGEITVPLAKIKELHSSGSFAVLRKDTPITKKPVTPGTITVTGDSVEVSTSAGNSATRGTHNDSPRRSAKLL